MYFYGQISVKNVKSYKIGNHVAVFNDELSASNAEREVVRLKQYIAGLEKENELLKQGKGIDNNSYLTKDEKDMLIFQKHCLFSYNILKD